jgi:uncharacterized membrane protein YtjA (UPF0391 family)
MRVMLTWTLAFFILAIVAAALGFSGVAANLHYVAWILALVFLALFVTSLLRRSSKPYR